jgi:hypothetical protein
MNADPAFWPAALRMSSGVIVWALHFTLIYGYTALACARGFGGTSWFVGAATVLAALLALAIFLANLSREFTRWLSAALAAAALVGIVFEGLTPLFVTNPCAPL